MHLIHDWTKWHLVDAVWTSPLFRLESKVKAQQRACLTCGKIQLRELNVK